MRRLLTLFVAITLFGAPAFSQKKDVYKVRTVVVDPGHGGAKPGALGGRIQEKALTLSIAKKFGKLIADNYPDVKVVYTRTSDVDISLAERAHIANRNKADLFISIHANSHPTGAPSGVETFVMGLSESRANLEVAKKENADILLEADYKTNEAYKGFDPNAPESFVMLAMYQNAYLDKSLNFAQAIQNQYKKNLKTINRGVKQAELFVLYKTTCPSVLTEVGFISNPAEEAFMISDEGQAKIALSLFNAFMNFKATEEGTNKIANPKIDLPGYVAPAQAEAPAPEPVVAEVVEPVKPVEPVKTVETPKPVEPVAAPETKAPVAAPERPVPTRDLAPRVEVPASVEVKPVETPKPVEVKPVETPKPVEVKPVEAPKPVEVKPVETPKPVEVDPEPVVVTLVETPETPEPPKAPEPVAVRTPLAAPRNTATSATEFYTVQVLTSGKELPQGDPAFMGLENVMTTRNGQLYCYSVGRFATFAEADAYCAEVRSHTPFKDAWAVRRKVEPAPALAPRDSRDLKDLKDSKDPKDLKDPKVAKASNPAPTPQPAVKAEDKGTHYRIQFCTASRLLNVGDRELEGIKDIHHIQSGRFHIYSCGNYTSLDAARKRLATIHTTTSFKDAFIFGIKDGKRFKVD